MIERWFPCAEVSEASATGWGTGNGEKALFTWFAARPLAQAKAAVITSLLPWPDNETEQVRLQDLVRRSLADRDGAQDELIEELAENFPNGASMIDPFSGRAMIPLEAARLGVKAWGVDYSPVANLAGQLLADYPLRDWSGEADLPLDGYVNNPVSLRLVQDVKFVLEEVGRRWIAEMASFYPEHQGNRSWGYLWAITIPCQECGRRFPLVGSLVLRHPLPKKDDPGAWFRIDCHEKAGTYSISVHTGSPDAQPTRVLPPGQHKYSSHGRVAVCPFASCQHVHLKSVVQRLLVEGEGKDTVLVAADVASDGTKEFRVATAVDEAAIALAREALDAEEPFARGMPARPDEVIPSWNTWTIQPLVYGAKTYGDLCNDRQTLGFVRLARTIDALGEELQRAGLSADYVACLTGYCASVVVRKLKFSTRGAALYPRKSMTSNRVYINHIFGSSESSIAVNFDYFEVGLGSGPGSWDSLMEGTLRVLEQQVPGKGTRPAVIQRGNALDLPIPSARLDAVVTDPPYDSMIEYTDASDLFYVWLKRSLLHTHPDLAMTVDPRGIQEKTDEIIVSKMTHADEHRTRSHYDARLAHALHEARRVVKEDGVVTIVFGHGEPEVWHRLLQAIETGGLYLTGSWPARTESGGAAGSANIVTTLTMSCRPVATDRPVGRANDVRSEIREAIVERVPMWDRAGLALTDQLMASAGPAMEVVGTYSAVLDPAGERVEPLEFLAFARRVVEEVAAIRVEDVPLEAFDARTRFALFWARLFGRGVAAKSEARWQAMASDLTLDDLKGVLKNTKAGTRLVKGSEASVNVSSTSSVIDVALAAAAAWPHGLDAVSQVFSAAGRDSEDSQVFAAITYLSSTLTETDEDRQSWNGIVRNRKGLGTAIRTIVGAAEVETQQKHLQESQGNLFQLDASELS